MPKIVLPPAKKLDGAKLFPFQEEGLLKQLEAPLPVIYNGDEMGLGKTVQALVYANSTHSENVLVVCPAGARLNWARESNKWFAMRPGRPAFPLLSSKGLKDLTAGNLMGKVSNPSPLIVSYDLLVMSKPVRNYVTSRKWDLIVVDEAHNVKKVSAKRTQVLYHEIFPQCKKIYMMSGTPLTNSAMDLFPFLNMVAPHVPGISPEDLKACEDYDTYGCTFCYRWVHHVYGVNYKGVRQHARLKSLLYDTGLFFRRTKDAVLEDLPEKSYVQVDLPLKVESDLSDEKIGDFLDQFKKDDGSFASRAQTDIALMSLRRKLGAAKANSKEVIEYIKELLDGYKRPVVLFAYHKEVISSLKSSFSDYNPVVFDGSTSAGNKQAAVDSFQAGASQVFIGQLTSANVAITLTRSSDVIFIEYDWLSANNNQAVDRVYRIGQKNAVTAHYLVSEHPFDRALVEAMIRKHKSIERVI